MVYEDPAGTDRQAREAEDGVKGRFFEVRFKSQILLSQNAIFAEMDLAIRVAKAFNNLQ